MIRSNSTTYPPGCNRRLIDWVRSPDSFEKKCSGIGCTETFNLRETPEGCYCVACYEDLKGCSDPNCHRPALSGLESQKRAGGATLNTCRQHHYVDEREINGLHRESLVRGQSHSAGYTFPG